MKWLSNIIRTNHFPILEKKIIETKKIDTILDEFEEDEIDSSVKKRQLLQEINVLESQYQELLQQIETKKTQAQEEIELWWTEKQQEAEAFAEKKAVEAEKAGFAAGFNEGMLKAEQQYQSKIQQAEELIQTAHKENKKIILNAERFLLELSVKIAEKVIQSEITSDHQKFVNMIRLSLKQIEEAEDITIEVAPEDYSNVLPFVEELQIYVSPDSPLKLVPSSKLSQGGCMIHTPNGSYDVTIDHQLTEIKKQLLAYFEGKTTNETNE